MPGEDKKTLLDKLKTLSTDDFKCCVRAMFLLAPQPPSLKTVEFCNVKEGDHLVYLAPSGGINSHFYVQANLGDGKIEVYGWFSKGTDDPFIEQKLLDEHEPSSHRNHLKIETRVLDEATLDLKQLKRQIHETTNITEEKQRLEMYKTENTSYHSVEKNSEHFVTYVKTGNPECQLYTKRSVATYKSAITTLCLYVPKDLLDILCTLSGALEEHNADDIISVATLIIDVLKKVNVTASAGGTFAEAATAYRVLKSTKGTYQVVKKVTKQATKNAAYVNGLVEGCIWAFTITKASRDYRNGTINRTEFRQLAVNQTTTSLSTFAMGTGGTAAGTAIGTAIGTSIFPGVGSIIGAGVGGFVGGISGNFGGTKLGNYTGNLINSFWGK